MTIADQPEPYHNLSPLSAFELGRTYAEAGYLITKNPFHFYEQSELWWKWHDGFLLGLHEKETRK